MNTISGINRFMIFIKATEDIQHTRKCDHKKERSPGERARIKEVKPFLSCLSEQHEESYLPTSSKANKPTRSLCIPSPLGSFAMLRETNQESIVKINFWFYYIFNRGNHLKIYYVYILSSSRGTLYTGVTNNKKKTCHSSGRS